MRYARSWPPCPAWGEPSRRLQQQFDAYAEQRYGLRAARFERDIKPWLGTRIAGFSLLPGRGRSVEQAPSGLIAATRDEKKARHWLLVVSRRMDGRERAYRGVRTLLGRGARPRFAKALVHDDERLGVVWYDTRRLADAVARRVGGSVSARGAPRDQGLIPTDPLVLTVRAKTRPW